jgi:hypothetical protein
MAGRLMGILLFLMVIAALSRILTMKEPAKIVGGGLDALSNLFKGVFK